MCKDQKYLDEASWVDKIMQLNQILNINHGVILVGPSGTGKSTAWQTLRAAQELVDQVKIDTYVIDPKAFSKDDLYGTLDPTTLEWTNGVFTFILRKVCVVQLAALHRVGSMGSPCSSCPCADHRQPARRAEPQPLDRVRR